MPTPPSRLLGVLALLGALILWSSWAVVSRWSFAHSSLGSWELGLLRFSFAGVVMAPLLVVRGFGGLSWRTMLVITFCAGPGYASLAYFGMSLAPASHGAALTAGMLPLFTTLLAVFLKLTKPTLPLFAGLGLLVAAAGAFFVDGLGDTSTRTWLGDLVLIMCPAIWAVFTVIVKQQNLKPLHATAIVSVLGFFLYLPIYAVMGSPETLVETSPLVLLSLGLFHGVLVVVIALTFFSYAVVTLGPAITTLSLSTVPAFSTLGAYWLLGEPMTQWSVLGVALDGVGIVFVYLAARRRYDRVGISQNAEESQPSCPHSSINGSPRPKPVKTRA